MKKITCPACKAVNAYEAANCARCGENFSLAKMEAAIAAVQATSDRFRHEQAAHSNGFGSINGFGTGLMDYRPRGDGSWDAVRWVIAGGVPLIPLGGYVIQPHHEDHTYGRHRASFTVLDRFPLTAGRVLRTYGLVVVGILPLLLGFLNSAWLNRTVGSGPAFFVMLAAIFWAGYFVLMRTRNDGKVYKPLPPRPAA